MYHVYLIGKKENLVSHPERCYVGVTNDMKRRWDMHTRSKYTIGQYIRSNELTFENNMISVFVGSEEECFEIEAQMRPIPMMGLNEAKGGHGGYTSYTQDRNRKISNALKGRPKSEDHIRKIMSSRKTYIGENNPNSKRWEIRDPDGNIYMIEGSLGQFCESNKILQSCLRRYIDNVVPDPNYSGYGGFRSKSERSRQYRTNTTGWSLKMVNLDREV